MCPSSHAVSLDHSDEDGNVAQRTALTARYTDTQSIRGTLRENFKEDTLKANLTMLRIKMFEGLTSYPCDLNCTKAWLCHWMGKKHL